MADFKFKKADLGVFHVADCEKVLENFGHGCRIMGLSNGRFSLIDLIKCMLGKTGAAHLIVCTWSAGVKDVFQVRWMMDTELVRSFNLITDYSYIGRKPKYVMPITDIIGEENIRTSEVHAKFVLIHNDEYHVAIRTSMNLNANKTIESFEIDEDKEIFDFYMNFVEHTFGDMPKGFSGEEWRAVASMGKYFNRREKEDWDI